MIELKKGCSSVTSPGDRSVELYLVRHGETTWNASRRYQGQSESDLSPRGRDQAVAVGRRLAALEFSGAYASDLRRTVATAEIILADRAVPLTPSPLRASCTSATSRG